LTLSQNVLRAIERARAARGGGCRRFPGVSAQARTSRSILVERAPRELDRGRAVAGASSARARDGGSADGRRRLLAEAEGAGGGSSRSTLADVVRA